MAIRTASKKRLSSVFGIILLLALCKVVAQDSRNTERFKADSLYALGNYTIAINFYAKDGSLTSALQIARAYDAIGSYDKAAAQYEAIISKDASQQIARFELGKILLKLKQAEKAKTLFVRLTEIDSTNAAYFYYLGKSLQSQKNGFMANRAFRLAIRKDSTHLRSLFEMAKHFVGEREKDSVLIYTDKGLEVYPDDVSLINLKALALYNNEQYAQALPLFERLVELGEQKEFIYSKLAYCYFRTWEFEKAKTAYNKVLKINDGNADAYFNMGQIFLKDREIDSAKIYIEEAIAVQKPFLVREYESLARIARIQENVKLAFEYYKLAYAEDPDNARVYFNVCTTADEYYKDPETILPYYEKFVEKFGKIGRYMTQTAKKRISELKEEIHFDTN